jgi:hypothetical protein
MELESPAHAPGFSFFTSPDREHVTNSVARPW